jgi:hypothetical protein
MHEQTRLQVHLDTTRLRGIDSGIMMSLALLSRQTPLDDWLLLPTKEPYHSRAAKAERTRQARYARHLLFDIGRGRMMALPPDLHEIVVNQMRRTYQVHVENCKRDGRTPMPLKGAKFTRWWKVMSKAHYIQWDLPKRARDYEKVA